MYHPSENQDSNYPTHHLIASQRLTLYSKTPVMSGLEKVRGLPRGKVFGWKVHSWLRSNEVFGRWWTTRECQPWKPLTNHTNLTNLYKSDQKKLCNNTSTRKRSFQMIGWIEGFFRFLMVLVRLVVYNHRIGSIYHLYTRYILPSRGYIIPTTYHQNQNNPLTESSWWDV